MLEHSSPSKTLDIAEITAASVSSIATLAAESFINETVLTKAEKSHRHHHLPAQQKPCCQGKLRPTR